MVAFYHFYFLNILITVEFKRVLLKLAFASDRTFPFTVYPASAATDSIAAKCSPAATCLDKLF